MRSASIWQAYDLRAKQSRVRPGSSGIRFSGLGETGREGEGGLGILYVAECFAHQLLGDAGAFAALGGHAGGLADLTVTAAAIIDGVANLTCTRFKLY